MASKRRPPEINLCNGPPYLLHRKSRLSKRNFLTGSDLHENYVMNQRLVPPELFYTCNVFEGQCNYLGCVFFAYSWRLPAYS